MPVEDLDARALLATHLLDFARGLATEARGDAAPLRLAFLRVDARADGRATAA